MKKIFFILIVLVLSLTSGIVFAACIGGTSNNNTPKAPQLRKSSFSVAYKIGDDGVEYDLIWRAENAVKYKVECGEIEIETTDASYSLTDLSADTVHAVTVTAIGENDLQSQPVELKFKGTKLEAPKNVRMYYDDSWGTVFGWDEYAESPHYLISFEELDLEIETSKPFGTGKFKYVQLDYDEQITLDGLRSIFKGYELYALESLRVQNLPYHQSYMAFDFASDTEVLEFNLPSDFSEQSVNLYAGNISNPTNLRWGETLDKYGNAIVKWDGAISDYEYKVMIQHPEGYSSGIITPEKGVSEGKVSFDYRMTTGDYTVTVEPVYDEFHYIGKDDDAKSVTYMFYLPQPITETLSFRLTRTALETPQNVRFEDGYIVCDEVEYAEEYIFSISNGREGNTINLLSVENRISFEEFFGSSKWLNEDGYFDLSVYADNDDAELTGFDNGIPQITIYRESESAVIPKAVQLKYIPAVQNVRIDYDTNTVYWDGIEEAETYTVMFYRESGSGNGRIDITDTQFKWSDNMDISDYSEVVITAEYAFNVTIENGVAVMFIPSKCRTPIQL